MSKFEFFMKKYYILYIINHKVQKKHMTKEQAKYFPQTKSELRSLIENRIKVEGNEADLNDIDVSVITDMSGLFSWTDFNGDISDWNVSHVTDMSGMFCSCKKFNQDLSKWNVSNVINKLGTFYNCGIKSEYKPKFK